MDDNEAEVSKILVEFHDMTPYIMMQGVTPYQLLALAGHLELQAKLILNDHIRKQMEANADRKLSVPDQEIVTAKPRILTGRE